MSYITFDTYAFVKKLESSGMSHATAEALLDAQLSILDSNNIATKSDVSQLDNKLDKLESKVSSELLLLKWMQGTTLAFCIGILFLLLRQPIPIITH